ncbi:alpha/beta fold hydrolase [Kitasatospora sp. NPDC096140]|uniref:thioesterase II family protein n=1 Tax=Kitasatospora sp. NPDC096140 TaxID=3155425 RepID=UPI00331DC8FC
MNRTAVIAAKRAHGWIVGARRPAAPSVRLLCLPHAGGGSSAYASWAAALDDTIEVCPVELPGRQSRWRDQAFTESEPLVDALATAIEDELDTPYALFGHSMGALLAYELARALRRRGLPEPCALFVSGGPAPQLPREQPGVHDQPDDVVVAKLRTLGGLPEDVLAEPELLEVLLPAIRADLSVCERYHHRPEPPLGCPVVAFAGAEDAEVPPTRMEAWREQTTAEFELHVLPGDHFFVRSSQAAILETVRVALASVSGRGRA